MKSAEIRQTFTQYFEKNGHTNVVSSSLVPENDPTLLFANAGMNQFKNTFLGLETRDYNRAVSVQKCVRAGGKHNDLDNVGFTARHHTFFEMLGNFSFGDYFKKDAIHFAWELLTKEYQIPKEKLYVTVFEKDDEAADIWHKQENIPRDRIFKLGEKDNFWRMGEVGPCGPCSEIFYDHGRSAGKETDPYKGIISGEDRFVEIWNLVFMQFDEKSPGNLIPLPKPSVDTGSGLERVCAALQGLQNNYDTDLFTSIIDVGCKISGKDYIRKKTTDIKILENMAALRVLADHSRSIGSLIADGTLPANEGRGYVVRRILRRALRFGRKISPDKSVFPSMVEAYIKSMNSIYPELLARKDHILSTVKEEESRFLTTLDQGTEILNHELEKLIQKNQKTLPGSLVFKLYDTYGFPADLTEVMAHEKGFSIDSSSFAEAMRNAKNKAKASWKSHSMKADEAHLISWSQEVSKKSGATKFIGYETLEKTVRVLALSDGLHEQQSLNDKGYVITDATPFYAEGGGQAGDQGWILENGEKIGKILNCTKSFDLSLHHFEMKQGHTLKTAQPYFLQVESSARRRTAANHSATHLLHAALRKALGTHVSQAGSLVDSAQLRFDFTHTKSLTTQELKQVENLVNEQVALGRLISVEVMSHSDALKKGAIALFGEKYGNEVRVLTMGDFSCELCGGTHAKNTSEIRLFKIVSESGVSAGVRRIEALTSDYAFDYLNKLSLENLEVRKKIGLTESWDSLIENKTMAISQWVDKKQEEIKHLEKEIKKAKSTSVHIEDLLAKNISISCSGKDVQLILTEIPLDDREAISAIADKIKDKVPTSGLFVLLGQPTQAADNGGAKQFPIIISVTKNLNPQVSAGNILKTLSQKFNGKGGGRPDFAQGSLPINDLKQIYEVILQITSGTFL